MPSLVDFSDPRPNCTVEGCERKADVIYQERKLCSLHALLRVTYGRTVS